MRLFRVQKLEARAALPARAGGVGLVWSCDDSRVARELEPGELLAVDMHVIVPEGQSPARVRLAERVTLDESDLGWVYDAAGARVGRVIELDGSLISWRPEPAASDAAAPIEGSGATAPD